MRQFEIEADRDDLGDPPSIIEFQHRHRAFRVDRAKFGSELLAAPQIDLHRRHGDALLSEEDADALRVGRKRVIVKLHRDIFSPPVVMLGYGLAWVDHLV